MNIEQELTEGWEKAAELERELINETKSLEEQLTLLKAQVGELAAKLEREPRKSIRVELLARLCLLSELYSATDFDHMIEIRERFQELLPEHFSEYLAHLKTLSWHISWSGCLSCRHFLGRCNLNLTPVEVPGGEHRLEKTCPSWVRRSRKV